MREGRLVRVEKTRGEEWRRGGEEGRRGGRRGGKRIGGEAWLSKGREGNLRKSY